MEKLRRLSGLMSALLGCENEPLSVPQQADDERSRRPEVTRTLAFYWIVVLLLTFIHTTSPLDFSEESQSVLMCITLRDSIVAHSTSATTVPATTPSGTHDNCNESCSSCNDLVIADALHNRLASGSRLVGHYFQWRGSTYPTAMQTYESTQQSGSETDKGRGTAHPANDSSYSTTTRQPLSTAPGRSSSGPPSTITPLRPEFPLPSPLPLPLPLPPSRTTMENRCRQRRMDDRSRALHTKMMMWRTLHHLKQKASASRRRVYELTRRHRHTGEIRT